MPGPFPACRIGRCSQTKFSAFTRSRPSKKALEAWCAHRSIAYPLTHDLSELLSLLREDGCTVKAFDDLLRFNAFAVLFRYEALDEEAPNLDRERVIGEIDALLAHVAEQVE
jgi:HEPN domain-containing protein